MEGRKQDRRKGAEWMEGSRMKAKDGAGWREEWSRLKRRGGEL